MGGASVLVASEAAHARRDLICRRNKAADNGDESRQRDGPVHVQGHDHSDDLQVTQQDTLERAMRRLDLGLLSAPKLEKHYENDQDEQEQEKEKEHEAAHARVEAFFARHRVSCQPRIRVVRLARGAEDTIFVGGETFLSVAV